MKSLKKGLNDLESTKRKPKEPQDKFPPTFHKSKSKFKKFTLNVS